MFATTVVPSLDELGGILTLQRITPPSVHISHVGWDKKNNQTIAILEGEYKVLDALNEAFKRYDLALDRTNFLSHAIRKAQSLADVVEFEDERREDYNTI